MGITDTQSYALVIRDAFFDAVTPDPFFADYTCRKTKMLAVQSQLLPYLGVYTLDETMVPDGDANAGEVRFSHTLRIGFSAMVANNDQVVAEQIADAAIWRVMQILWPNAHIMNVLVSSLPDNTIIESITRGARRPVYGATNLANETPIIEMQYDVSVFYRTSWPPIITDDLNEIDVSTGIKIGDTQTEMDQRQQISVKYMFNQLRKAMTKESRR
jgi:hypothetical protein